MFDFDSLHNKQLNEDFLSPTFRKIAMSDSFKNYQKYYYHYEKDVEAFKKKVYNSAKKTNIAGYLYNVNLAAVKEEDLIKIDTWDKGIKTIKKFLKQNPAETYYGFFFNSTDDLVAISRDDIIQYKFSPQEVVTPKSFDETDFEKDFHTKTEPKYQSIHTDRGKNNFGKISLTKLPSDNSGNYVYILMVEKNKRANTKLKSRRSNRKEGYIPSDKEKREQAYDDIKFTKSKERKTLLNKLKTAKFVDPYVDEIPKILETYKDFISKIELRNLKFAIGYRIKSLGESVLSILDAYRSVFQKNQQIFNGNGYDYIIQERDSKLKEIESKISSFHYNVKELEELLKKSSEKE